MNRSTTTARSFSPDQLRSALVDVGGPVRPDYLADILDQAGRTRQRPRWTFADRWLSADVAVRRKGDLRTAVLAATLVLLALLAAAGIWIGSQLTRPVDLGIFSPVAGWIVYGDEDGIWAVDPASSDPVTTVQLTSEPGVPLGWSRDGTRLLIQKDHANLYVLHADGSETQVTEQLSGNGDIPGSGRPSGATISPDGSRVVFAGQTTTPNAGCHDGALFAIDAEGGPARLLWTSQAHNGIVRNPSFSPDGGQIAFVDGYCDNDHSVWVMNSDGSDPHQIVPTEMGPLGATHVRDLAWSPAGDRIALAVDEGIYTFAPDGSDVTGFAGAKAPISWSPDGSEIAYLTACVNGDTTASADGCRLRIKDADGPSVRLFGNGKSGPWHPGSHPQSVLPTAVPTPNPTVSTSPSVDPSADPSSAAGSWWPQSTLEEVQAAQDRADAGDPAYTWQVDRQLGNPERLGQHHPRDAEVFSRFIEEVLGWEKFRWAEAFAHPDGLEDGEVVYIRCAAGASNPLYANADDPCAPTIDELHYETVRIAVAQPARQDATGIWVVTSWSIESAAQTGPPTAGEIKALVEPFLQARIDGVGAEALADLVNDDPNSPGGMLEEVPLLYATSTGAPYKRSEFENAEGPRWPDGWTQLKLRLFTADDETVVEQLFTVERDDTGRLRLGYDFRQVVGPDGPVAATTENSKSVPGKFGLLDGEVTFRLGSPLAPSTDGFSRRDRVAIVGVLPDDESPRRIVLMLADPRPIGPDCSLAAPPATAAALAESLQSDPDFRATAPVPVTIGGASALQMDVFRVASATACRWSEHGTSGEGPLLLEHAPFAALPFYGDRARLYLIDIPGGSARVLALATIADEDSLQTVLAWVGPILDSIEFHAP